jgi:hypothetical protein
MRIRNTGFQDLLTSQSVNPQRRAEHCFPKRRQSTGRLGSSLSCQPSTCTRAPPAPGTLPQILTAPQNIKKTASYLFTNRERKPSYHDQPSIEMKCGNFSNVIMSRFLRVSGPRLKTTFRMPIYEFHTAKGFAKVIFVDRNFFCLHFSVGDPDRDAVLFLPLNPDPGSGMKQKSGY